MRFINFYSNSSSVFQQPGDHGTFKHRTVHDVSQSDDIPDLNCDINYANGESAAAGRLKGDRSETGRRSWRTGTDGSSLRQRKP